MLYKETPFTEKKKTKEPSRSNQWELLSQPVTSESKALPQELPEMLRLSLLSQATVPGPSSHPCSGLMASHRL